VTITGEYRSRTYAPHHEVALLGHRDGSVIVGKKNRKSVSIFDPDGFSQKNVELQEPVYSLARLDEDTVIVNSISHLEFLSAKDLHSVGFIDNSNPMDLAFAAKGGFFQVCLLEGKTKISFAEFI
jgi:hypothetical protein